jgi:hypothetical protein|tara:strand:- start:283 stop:468 length:186 start_codon:yes stop_codon:yes gene_type:complete
MGQYADKKYPQNQDHQFHCAQANELKEIGSVQTINGRHEPQGEEFNEKTKANQNNFERRLF